MTLYRAGGDSPIARSLIRAAERGVQVAVLVELKARFDEATNVSWAKTLERAGVHVVYGLVGLKTHAKCVLVVRNDDDGLRRYCHIGTGNYNSRTARLYEDLGFLTCDPDVGADVAQLFNHLTGYSRNARLPDAARRAARPARPAARPDRARGRASAPRARSWSSSTRSSTRRSSKRCTRRAGPGCTIDLIVRGICCLRAGVPGLSREHPRASHPRSLPRALAGSSGSRHGESGPTASRQAAVPHRLGRLDAAQPRPARRGARAGRATRSTRPGSTRCSRSTSPTTSCAGSSARRQLGAHAARTTLRADAQERMYRWVVERQAHADRAEDALVRCRVRVAVDLSRAPFTSRSPTAEVRAMLVPTVAALSMFLTERDQGDVREHFIKRRLVLAGVIFSRSRRPRPAVTTTTRPPRRGTYCWRRAAAHTARPTADRGGERLRRHRCRNNRSTEAVGSGGG